jgi:hypothetical protein
MSGALSDSRAAAAGAAKGTRGHADFPAGAGWPDDAGAGVYGTPELNSPSRLISE